MMTKKIALCTIISLSTFVVGVMAHRSSNRVRAYLNELTSKRSAWQVLMSFENQDMEALDEGKNKLVQGAIDELIGSGAGGFTPSIFKSITNKEVKVDAEASKASLLRSRTSVQKRLSQLSESRNSWIRERATTLRDR